MQLKNRLWNYFRKGHFLRDLALFGGVLLAVEFYQNKDHFRGPLPNELGGRSWATLEGQELDLWHKSQPTLLYAFAPWCQICRIDASVFSILGDDWRIVALGMSWEELAELQDFQNETGLIAPVIPAAQPAFAQLQVQAFPTYFIVNKKGQVVYSWAGYTSSLGLVIRAHLGAML